MEGWFRKRSPKNIYKTARRKSPTPANLYRTFQTRKDVGLRRDVIDLLKSSGINFFRGVQNAVVGATRQGKRAYRTTMKQWSELRYRQAIRQLRKCTTDCDDIEDCCTYDEIQDIKTDIFDRETALLQLEKEKRDYLLAEVANYVTQLSPQEADTFTQYAKEQIELDYTNAREALHRMKSLKGGTRRR